MLCDSHCHFFSDRFFAALADQRSQGDTASTVCHELGWDPPGAPEGLADRWVAELDRHGVSRVALIASVPGDETSVAAAVARHPNRFVGFCMVDPSREGAAERSRHAVSHLGLRGLCLFPAMHHVALSDTRTEQVVQVAADHPGTAVFVHCGVLSIGVRGKLGLPSRFDLRLGDPRGAADLALAFPAVPFIIPNFGAGRLDETLAAAADAPNIHVDTSSSNGWIQEVPGLTLAAVFTSTVTSMGAARVLFGTDSSFFPRGWQRALHDTQRAAAAAAGLTSAQQSLVFGGNFDRLFPALGQANAEQEA
jgi:hypothetical protein